LAHLYPIVRVAVCFYGLIRNISTTLPSIEQHVFGELEKNDISYDVFVHSLLLVGPKCQ
jgi:hypothetical protein